MPNQASKNSPKDDSVVAQKRNEKVVATKLKKPSTPVGSQSKEQEPAKNAAAELADIEEKKLMAEIRTTSEAADKQALEALQGTVKEIKRGTFEPELPPDVEDAGVVNPQKAAEQVVENGSEIDLPIDEDKYKVGVHVKVSGRVDDQKVVTGPPSLAAFAIWIGRMLKIAHKHTMRVVFRKGEKNAH